MSRASLVVVAAVGIVLAACSGKTERGSGSDLPADRPAVGANAAPEPQPSEGEQPSPSRHVLMIVELELAARSARVLKAKPVELPLPRRRGPAQRGAWQVDVLDAHGKVLYTAPLADGSTVRGEAVNEHGELTGARVQKERSSLTLRLPVLTHAATVRVSSLSDDRGAVELGSVPYPKVAP